MGGSYIPEDLGRRRYNTYFRQCVAVRQHLVGLGVPDVNYKGSGYSRVVTIPGLNVKVRTNLRRDFVKKGRGRVLADMTKDDKRPLVVFEVPTFADDPEDILVTMPIDTFVHLVRREP